MWSFSLNAIQVEGRQKAIESGHIGDYYEVALERLYSDILSHGGSALDGGANSGLHSITMAKRLADPNARVIAVEPQPDLIAALEKWAAADGVTDSIQVVNAALTEEPGEAVFFVDSDNPALSSLRVMHDEREELIHEIKTKCLPIDDVVGDTKLSFIKLDLEGGEFGALRGARKVIERDKPLIVFENGLSWSAKQFGYKFEDFERFFDEIGYEVVSFLGEPFSSELDGRVHFMFVAAPKGSKQEEIAQGTLARFWSGVSRLRLNSWDDVIAEILREK
ncbi:FkbM family methyltransferase [Henriciella mobilis]|uniref:FkbM family methyltransferase n=1 Tax=Henriciella mobilis TaxID=2305467 RepID=A0A399RQY8_9PROT|nr:FkbM family methyltransferase [Henriciella mobilis]RIJ32317.1 FkbM family methyltransferase [Henriciella mobilis]